MNNDANTGTQEHLDGLVAREFKLEELFAWDHSTKGFAWTGTEAERTELDAIRDEISNHPIILAEDRIIARAEARC